MAKQAITQKHTKKVQQRDLTKIKPSANRIICYCQATKHGLVNNCINCGKIVCEQEGEGPCLFCGAWVDRETMVDFTELGDNEENEALARKYEKAL